MDTKDRAAEALRLAQTLNNRQGCEDEAADMLREYAALLQDQPVAWTSNEELRRVSQGYGGTMAKTWFPDGSGEVPLYTRPKPAEAGRVPPGWKLVPPSTTP